MKAAAMKSIRIGDLLVHVWPAADPDAPVVIAAHGITANGLSWAQVAQALDGRATLAAPDLRGRAGSRDAPGPYGIARHADDLIAILDELSLDGLSLDGPGADSLGAGPAVLAGHSMGAFVAAVAAVRHPGRVSGVVLVDGGLTLTLPPGIDLDAVLAAVLGPAMARLDMTFPDRESYRTYWQAHPAFAATWTPMVEAYIEHDLIGDGPFRSSCVVEAVRTDGGQVLVDAQTLAAIHALPVPGVLLYAERGLLDEPQALYDPQRLAGLEIPAVRVADTNHYSILVSDKGAAAVADHLLRMAGAGPDA